MAVRTERFTNALGKGNRTSSITVTGTAVSGGVGLNKLVDGGFITTTGVIFDNGVSNAYIAFDFGSGVTKSIKGVTWYKATSSAGSSTWKFQGSNDNSTWFDLTNTVTLNATTGYSPSNSYFYDNGSNYGFYRYFRMLETTGTTINTYYNYEFEFLIVDGGTADNQSAIAPSYSNFLGTGDRTPYINLQNSTTTFIFANVGVLVDGDKTSNQTPTFSGLTGTYIQFDFQSDCLITEITSYLAVTSSLGTWKWQGYDRTAASWVDLGTSFTLGATSPQVINNMSAVTDYYASYRLQQVSGSTNTTARFGEFEFKIGYPVIGALAPIQQDLILNYAVQFQKDLILDYEVGGTVLLNLILNYAVELQKDLILNYSIPNFTYYFYNYPLVNGATIVDGPIAGVLAPPTASVIDGIRVGVAGSPVAADHFIGDTVPGFPVFNFYGDYYLRIWMDPTIVRLSNPRYNAPISFHAWNAYPDSNNLIEAIATDLDGVVLNFTMPLSFKEYEFKTMTFSITTDAPATLNGHWDFVFDEGAASLAVIATIIGVLELRANEPIVETWSWLTMLNIAKGSPEHRAATRINPRYEIDFDTTLVDETARRVRYEQLWTFIARDLQVPLYQYRTPITAPSITGANRVYFDPAQTDVRSNEYFVLYNAATLALVLGTGTLEVDGLTLDASLAQDIDETWQVIPTMAMRAPDGSGLTMDSATGDCNISFLSTKTRVLLPVPNSPSLLTTFNSAPVLGFRPIAVSSLNDQFNQDVETIDNGAVNMELYTLWPQPFVSGTRQYLIDRTDPNQINYWREFGSYTKGNQNPFYIPSWREDLTLFETPVVGTSTIKVNEPTIVAQSVFGAYGQVQLLSDNGVKYLGIANAEDFGDYILLTLSGSIGDIDGDQNISMISFLNLARMNTDAIILTHSVNYTVVEIEIRTIDA